MSIAANVELWDLRKQQLAVREFHYFLARVQKHPKLLARFRAFAEENRLPLD